MKISTVRTRHLRAPWIEPPRFGPVVPEMRDILVVEVETEDGITGMGYLLLLRGGVPTVTACLHDLVIPEIIGRDATDIEGIWQHLWHRTYWMGRMGVAIMALSAVDVALWDALGRRTGLPLHRLWGHCNDSVRAYGSGCWRGYGPEGMVERAQRYVADGFDAIKMQCAHLYDRHQDVHNVALMREALGPRVEIMIDCNMGWTADEAIVTGRRFEDFDLYWLEEPVVCEDFAGYARIADALDLRIVGGESHFTRFDLRPFFEHPRIPILQPDVMRGGLTELRKIATVADTYGMTIAPHLFPELMIQIMASIPNPSWLEYVNWMDDAWIDPVLPHAGMVTPPERPGHGLDFRPDFLAEYQVD